MKIKPFDLVRVQEENYAFIGQIMSHPHNDTVMVRDVPGDSETLKERPLSQIGRKITGMRWVHYAKVKGMGGFPVDMLRYDSASPVNFAIEEGKVVSQTGDDLIVARVTELKLGGQVWTHDRWKSFLWYVEPIKTLKLDRGTR
jgi:hypothetical protein